MLAIFAFLSDLPLFFFNLIEKLTGKDMSGAYADFSKGFKN